MASPSYDWITHHTGVREDKLATCDLARGREFSYSEMNERTSQLPTAIRDEFGVQSDTRVAVLAENDINFFIYMTNHKHHS